MENEDLFESVEKLQKNVEFIANVLELPLPADKNYHDCRLYTIEMSGNEEGDLFLHMRNYLHKMKKIQVKYCPVCGYEGNTPPCFKKPTIPRKGDGS